MSNKQTTGNYQDVNQDMYKEIKDITRKGNDVQIRQHRDGSYDVYEIEMKVKRTKRGNAL